MADHERPVAVIDSGVGGLPYLDAARRLLPAVRFAYVADRGAFPYGTKAPDELRAAVLDLVARVVDRLRPRAVVIACNTASQVALAAVRRAHPGLPVVGTVPAVKPAAERTRSGVIGIMATARAVGDPYLDGLVARYAPGIAVIREAAQDLVEFVERRGLDSTEAERGAAVSPHVRRLAEAGADEIVLGCTHFLHVAEDLRRVAGAGVEIVDSREGVARRLRHVLAERGLASGGMEPSTDRGAFYLTGAGPIEEGYGRFAAAFGLRAPTALEGREG